MNDLLSATTGFGRVLLHCSFVRSLIVISTDQQHKAMDELSCTRDVHLLYSSGRT